MHSTTPAKLMNMKKLEGNLLNKVGNMVKSIFHNNWFLRLRSFSFSLSLGLFQETFLLGCLVLWPVLEEQLEQICCCNRT